APLNCLDVLASVVRSGDGICRKSFGKRFEYSRRDKQQTFLNTMEKRSRRINGLRPLGDAEAQPLNKLVADVVRRHFLVARFGRFVDWRRLAGFWLMLGVGYWSARLTARLAGVHRDNKPELRGGKQYQLEDFPPSRRRLIRQQRNEFRRQGRILTEP